MDSTPRLGLGLVSPGQAQKELTVNEAFQRVDMLIGTAVEALPLADPPSAPLLGSCYLVGPSATGAWTGKSECIAAFTSGGWRFVTPVEGVAAYVKPIGLFAVYRRGAWEIGAVRGASFLVEDQQVVGRRESAISSPSGGSVIDAQARAAVEAILQAMRNHGLVES
jgi:hypothetical protein